MHRGDWYCYVDDRQDKLRRFVTLNLVREVGDNEVESLQRDGSFKREPHDQAIELDPSNGIAIPTGAWRAICDAAIPSVGKGELARVEEALRVERERVDRILGQR